MMCCAMKVGMFFAVLFVLCFARSWAWGDAGLQALHLSLLKVTFLWFTGINAISFVLGLVQSFIYGVAVVGIWRLISSSCNGDKCGGDKCVDGKCGSGDSSCCK